MEGEEEKKIFIAKIKPGTPEYIILNECKKLDVTNADAITFRLAKKGTFGFAEFATREDANLAIAKLNGFRGWSVRMATYDKKLSPSPGTAAATSRGGGLSWSQRERQRRQQFIGAGNTNDGRGGYGGEGRREREVYYRERDREREMDDDRDDEYRTRRSNGYNSDDDNNKAAADDDTIMHADDGVETKGGAGDDGVTEADKEQPRPQNTNKHPTSNGQARSKDDDAVEDGHDNAPAAMGIDSRNAMNKTRNSNATTAVDVNWRSSESDTPKSAIAEKSNDVGNQVILASSSDFQDCENFDEDAYNRERRALELKFARHKRIKRIREIESEIQKLQDEKTGLEEELTGAVNNASS